METEASSTTPETASILSRAADDLRLQLALAGMELRDWSTRQSERWHNTRVNLLEPAADRAWEEVTAAVEHLTDEYGSQAAPS